MRKFDPRAAAGVSPASTSSGVELLAASARAVTAFVSPGPWCTEATPTRPVVLAQPSAMQTAPCSWRAATNVAPSAHSALVTTKLPLPITPKTVSTPCAASVAPTASATLLPLTRDPDATGAESMLGAMPQPTREIHLAARPQGEPQPSDFRLAETELPDPGPGQLLVRNTWMSVDPYMRGRMRDARSYVEPFALDAALQGGAIGEVVASRDARFAEGDVVRHFAGWREHAVVDADAAEPVDTGDAPDRYALGALGMTGLTAYAGLHLAELREDDVVFVSGAAGAVGSMAAQLAKLRGHTVVGSAGAPEKVAVLLGEMGLDGAFDYHDGPVAELLGRVAPDGIDVYFDNVGGEHLEAAIGAMRVHGRIPMCGSIAGYNTPQPGPRNMSLIVGKRITIRGFLVGDHADLQDAFVAEAAPLIASGSIVVRETIVDGLEHAPQAFIDMLRGANTGKMLVRL